MEFAIVDETGDDVAVVGRHARIVADQPVDLVRIGARRAWRCHRPTLRWDFAEMGDDVAGDRDGVAVAFGQMVGHAADAAMHLAAAERFHADFFPCRGVDELRPAQEHRALIAYDDGLVAKRRHVGTARRRGPVNDGNLRNAFARHADLIVEDRAELAFVGEDVGLIGQVGAAGLHKRDAGEAVLPGEALRPDMLLAGDAVIGAALHRGIVGDDHAGAARDHADAGDDASAGRNAIVHAFAGQLTKLQEGGAGVHQRGDAFARQQLLALLVQLPSPFGAADSSRRAPCT